jgi:acetyl esterase/lipase
VRALIALLLAIACAGALFPWYPWWNEATWPVGMVARELWPWLLVVNCLGVVFATRRWRPLQLVFLGAAAASLWPLLQIVNVKREFARDWVEQGFAKDDLHEAEIGALFKNSFGGYHNPRVEPRPLPLGIQLYAPRTSERGLRPVLVDVHGGSWQHGGARTDEEFSSHYAHRGWVVFALEYRLLPAYKHPAQIDDVRASLDWVYEHARKHGGDPERIALVGRSAGGQLAMLAAYSGSHVPIRAVVNYYGPGDLAELHRAELQPDPLVRNAKVEALLGGSPDTAADAYRDASPSTYLRAGLPPTLHLQGTHDDAVGVGPARRFHERIVAGGSRSLFLEMPWSGHSFDFVYFGPGNTLSLAYVDSFLDATTARYAPPPAGDGSAAAGTSGSR